MLVNGRIPVNEAEHKALEKLLAEHGPQVSVTRRDPGESGPLLVHVGAETYQVAANGRTKKVA